ncbi:XRE family transcriptional regulator [Streptomyces sp. NPDC058405]|uniref:XRE family transcriptional regulator n=1 Tax=unclassified Streptomyces TaxID=2593676 RepID=UPI003651D3F8
MPRWKALPDELDPQVREFASQLRRLVDRSGLGIAALADRTGYSKTSWERYLNGRLLPPKGAILALAEVTGTHPVHLTTMWELAERSWSRSEMRHDMTMEQIRISQAREALGEFGRPPAGDSTGRRGAGAPGGFPGGFPGSRDAAPAGHGPGADAGRPRPSAVPQGRGPAGPGQPPGHAPAASPGQARGRRRATLIVAGVVGVLLVAATVVLLTGLGGDGDDAKPVAASPSPSPSTSGPALPAGVKCAADDCAGQDPEDMGCGGEFAKTVASATVGTALIEVRYSETCGAAWGRITQASVGDTVQITSGAGEGHSGSVDASMDAYTPMVAVPDAAGATACATLANGETGCTPAQ